MKKGKGGREGKGREGKGQKRGNEGKGKRKGRRDGWEVGWLVGWGLTALLTQNRSYRACRFVGIFYSKL